MASFSAGTTFTDGVANDVTAAKLAALVNAATPTSGLIQDRTAETTIDVNDTLLVGDASDSNNLKRMTVANFAGTLPTATITSGTITTLNSTTGTITTGVIPTLTSSTATFGTTTSTAATITSGTVTNLASTTGTIATLNSTTGTIATGVIPTLTSTTLITTGTGTAASPAIVPTGDTNTGIFFPAADTIAFSEGGTEAMRIDSSGNVGIGIDPASRLHVVANQNNCAYTSSGTTQHQLSTVLNGNNANLYYGVEGSSTGRTDINATLDNASYFGSRSAHATQLISNNSARMTIDSSGNVGIGTASPSAQLELSTDSAKKPSTNTWTIASDQRLKTNITNADNDRCYEIVKQVPLKRYTWKNEVYSQDKVKDRSKLGWIAQDVEAVFPKAVGTNRFAYNQVFEDVVTPELDSDGNAVLDENGVAKTKTEKRLVSEEVIEDCKDLNSDQIYAAMYGTIQKLIEKVETLEAKVAALEAA